MKGFESDSIDTAYKTNFHSTDCIHVRTVSVAGFGDFIFHCLVCGLSGRAHSSRRVRVDHPALEETSGPEGKHTHYNRRVLQC
jgi:hypothetical protein